jgi:predicted DsbA family dithiol-disulfide isomerase
MHGELFANDNQHDLEQLVHCATKVGLDGAACRKALLERTFAARVRELSVASVRSGIIGTPTLFINDTHYENRLEEPLLEAAIRRELEAPAT